MKYLSSEWFTAANELLSPLEVGEPLVVRTIVAAEEPIEFNLILGEQTQLQAPADNAAEVSIEYSYETAAAIAKGETNIREAILAEKINLSGDTIQLANASKNLTTVAKTLAPLSEQTEY